MNIRTILDYVMYTRRNTNRKILAELLRAFGGSTDGRFFSDDVINYVMHTRYNTNRAVLETMLRNMKGDTPPVPPVPPVPKMRSTLYNDGTFIINELPENFEDNARAHGAMTKEYPPFDETHDYVFASESSRYWHSDIARIKNVEFGSYVEPTSLKYWFKNCSQLQSFSPANLDTKATTDMMELFCGCTALTGFNSAGMDTSNVTSMRGMFMGCSNLTNLNISLFNTSKVRDFIQMFQNCSSLTSLDVTHFNTSSALYLAAMFQKCSSLTEINVSSFDTSNVVNLTGMFQECSSLTELDLSNFDTAQTTDMTTMFKNCGNLVTIYATDKFVTTSVINSNMMFQYCNAIVGGAGTTYHSNKIGHEYAVIDNPPDKPGYFTGPVLNKRTVLYDDGTLIINELEKDQEENERVHGSVKNEYPPLDETHNYDFSSSDPYWKRDRENIQYIEMGSSIQPINTTKWFEDCFALESFNNTNLNTSKTTNMSRMFSGCSFLSNLDLSNLNTTNATDMRDMFYGCRSLENLDISGFNTSNVTNMESMFDDCQALKNLDLSNFDTSKVSDMSYMFDGCRALENLDLSSFNTSKVTSMESMFCNCQALENLDVSSFDTSKVTSMAQMFNYCRHLTELDLSNFNTSNVEDMYGMFGSCSALQTLNLTSFDTSKVTDMAGMFSDCYELTGLDLSNFNTSQVTDMGDMFVSCTKLATLDISNFDTSNTTNMSSMFAGCNTLTTLDLSSFKTSKVTSMDGMFSGCVELKTIYATGDFVTTAVTSTEDVFENCRKLVGMAGTTFSVKTKEYARLDAPPTAPGYFTMPNSAVINVYSSPAFMDTVVVPLGVEFTPTWREQTGQYFIGWHFISSMTDPAFQSFVPTNSTSIYAEYVDAIQLTYHPNNGEADKIVSIPRNMTYTLDYTPTSAVAGDSFLGWYDNPSLTGIPITTISSDANIEVWAKWGAKVEDTHYLFADGVFATGVPEADVQDWVAAHGAIRGRWTNNYATDAVPWYSQRNNIQYVVPGSSKALLYPTKNAFAEHRYIKEADISNLIGIEAIGGREINADSMFYNCTSMQVCNVDIKDPETSVISAQSMFEECRSARISFGTSANAWSTGALQNCYKMFYRCQAQPNFYLQHFNFDNVTDMSWMFYQCVTAATIKFPENMDTHELKNVTQMFNGCELLTEIVNLGGMKTTGATLFAGVFTGTKVTELDLSGFDTTLATSLMGMFYNCTRLVTIYGTELLSNTTCTNYSRIFEGCTKLVGGNGTVWDAAQQDNRDYLWIDGKNGRPGYVTEKSDYPYEFLSIEAVNDGYVDSQTIYPIQDKSILGRMPANGDEIGSITLNDFKMDGSNWGNVTLQYGCTLHEYTSYYEFTFSIQNKIAGAMKIDKASQSITYAEMTTQNMNEHTFSWSKASFLMTHKI